MQYLIFLRVVEEELSSTAVLSKLARTSALNTFKYRDAYFHK